MGGCKEWQDAIPQTKSPLGIIFFILNIWPGLAGVGSILASFVNTAGKLEQCTLIIGILQWLLEFILIGWLWSIWWGFLIFKKQAK